MGEIKALGVTSRSAGDSRTLGGMIQDPTRSVVAKAGVVDHCKTVHQLPCLVFRNLPSTVLSGPLGTAVDGDRF